MTEALVMTGFVSGAGALRETTVYVREKILSIKIVN
jgi:hypothetical protein